MNNRIDSTMFGKRSLSVFDSALTASSEENAAQAQALESKRSNGDTDITQAQITKALTASKYQAQLVTALDDSEKKALLRVVNIGMIALACVDSYSLEKIASIARMLDAGSWDAHNDSPIACALAKVSDETTGEQFDLVAMRDNMRAALRHSGFRQTDMSLILLERMGMLKRFKNGRTYTHGEKTDSKIWESVESVLNA